MGRRTLGQSAPAFLANEPWERGSVFEPNVLFHDGKWKLWYVAGSVRDDHLVHGYAESEDGISGWTKHEVFAPREMRMFDFCIRGRHGGFDAIFSRLASSEGSPADVGLWWCQCPTPSRRVAEWSEPVHILTGEDRGWHSGSWKPSFRVVEDRRAYVFFSGNYRTSDPGPFPFAFTLGRLEVDLPSAM
jgi:hypothetical protein